MAWELLEGVRLLGDAIAMVGPYRGFVVLPFPLLLLFLVPIIHFYDCRYVDEGRLSSTDIQLIQIWSLFL